MRTRSLVNASLLAAVFGVCSWGCQATSSGGSGGSNDSGGQTSPGGGSGGNAGSTAGATGSGGAAGTTAFADSPSAWGTGTSFDSSKPPCDIYKDDGGPCVSAHSTVRVLSSAYKGFLYQVKKSDGTTKDIGFGAEGYANAADQDTFCGEDACTISIIYDQSGNGNDLTKAPPGQAKTTGDNEANAKALPITMNGHNVYGEHNAPGIGYRNNAAKGTASGDATQTVYMVAGGKYFNAGCCFDYGNAERNSHDNGEGTMEAVYFGKCTIWGRGDGAGPWIMGDLENGLWAGDHSPYAGTPSLSYDYVTGIVKGDKTGGNGTGPTGGDAQGHWVLKYADATTGGLQKPFEGKRPNPRYVPMRLEGAIILGTGGDNSNAGQGNFFEGVMTNHFSSDAADDAVQANIVAAGYGK